MTQFQRHSCMTRFQKVQVGPFPVKKLLDLKRLKCAIYASGMGYTRSDAANHTKRRVDSFSERVTKGLEIHLKSQCINTKEMVGGCRRPESTKDKRWATKTFRLQKREWLGVIRLINRVNKSECTNTTIERKPISMYQIQERWCSNSTQDIERWVTKSKAQLGLGVNDFHI
jgi:hypothetical protein